MTQMKYTALYADKEREKLEELLKHKDQELSKAIIELDHLKDKMNAASEKVVEDETKLEFLQNENNKLQTERDKVFNSLVIRYVGDHGGVYGKSIRLKSGK